MHMTAEIGPQAMPARNTLEGGAGHQATPMARRRIGMKGSLTGVQTMPLDQIKPNPRNPKTHSGKQIRQIANSIVGFGFTNPLLIDEHGELIAGHGRYQAAKLLGLTTVPVIVVDGLSRAKRRALAIADNKIAENSGWDRERLAIEIPELTELLSAEGIDISILGFDPVEIDQLQTDFEEESSDPQDSIEPKWFDMPRVSQPGDLWVLGNHRLMCGDARRADHISKLMASCRADMAFLDPPYNLKISGPSVAAKPSTPSSPWRAGKCHPPTSCDSSAPSWMLLRRLHVMVLFISCAWIGGTSANSWQRPSPSTGLRSTSWYG
jgi:hypothetical protein